MRAQKSIWVALVIAGAGVVLADDFSTIVVYECGCMEKSVQKAKAQADVVFRGTLTALRPSKNTKKIAVFRVDRVWKGEVGPTFKMPAIKGESACAGFSPDFLKVGNDILVYARLSDGVYLTSTCARTQLAKNTKDFTELGTGEEPRKQKNQPQ